MSSKDQKPNEQSGTQATATVTTPPAAAAPVMPTAAPSDSKRRAALAKACKCAPDEVLSWRDYPDRSVAVVVVCTDKFTGKLEVPL